jgi:peptidoglycan-associated lipoprotein
MKSLFRLGLFCLLIAVVSTGAGCKKRTKGLTPIPNPKPGVASSGPGGAIEGGGTDAVSSTAPIGADPSVSDTAIKPGPGGLFETANLQDFGDMLGDPGFFRSETVYFDFDHSSLKASETSKIQRVADYLKQNASNKVQVEGHCDERGTSEYNRSLGERRALAVREQLARLGIGPERVRTLSYGEDRPASDGNDETAWSRNRRAEFILLKPKP